MKKIFLLVVFVLILAPGVALAVDTLGTGLLKEAVNGLGLEPYIENSTANVISAALAVTGTIFLILTVSAGIMWMTAGGNEEKITKAKKIVIGAAIGLAITLTAYTITFFVAAGISGTGGGTCAGQGGTCLGFEGNCTDIGTEISGTGCASDEVCCKKK